MIGRVRRAASSLRRCLLRAWPRAIVLVYHRVAALDVDPWAMAVAPARFAEHMDILARYCRTLTATGLLRRLERGNDASHAVVVTFDDGYADLLQQALPLLDEAGVPATMFITTGAVGSGVEFWWDALERALLHDRPLPAELRLAIGDEPRFWSLGDGPVGPDAEPWHPWDPPRSAREAAYADVWQALLRLAPAPRERAIGELLRWAGTGTKARATHRALELDELERLAASPNIELGAHSVSHASLAALPEDALRTEIAGSRRWLSERIGRQVDTFAYPFGKAAHVDTRAVTAVRENEFLGAFMNLRGLVSGRTDRFRLPRVAVANVDGDAFCRLLGRIAGIRTG